MTKLALRITLPALLMAAAATPGLAQDGAGRPLTLRVAPGVDPGPGAFRPALGRRGAERAANSVGLADVDDVDLDEGVWTVTGTDVWDRDMTVVVDARSGRILQARYD